MNDPTPEAELELLTYSGSRLQASLHRDPDKPPEIRLFGNRPGILSLANLLLWFRARGDHEFLSVTQLPFVQATGAVSLTVRVANDNPTEGRCGSIQSLDGQSQFEWALPEDDLVHVALGLHHLGCFWEHEYELFPLSDEFVRDARVHARLTDMQADIRASRET